MTEPYRTAVNTWGPEEREAINRVLDSGNLTMGEEVAAFEQEFAAYMGSKHAVMVNSGSSANLVGLAALFHKRAFPLKRGDEVIVPALSWATTYHPLQQYGLKLRFVDIEIDTLNIDVEKVIAAITKDTKAILAVSILGNPAYLSTLKLIAEERGLYLIEDNCESMDAELRGQKTGTFGILGTFSTFFSHHMSTIEGGMIVTDDTEIAELARVIRNHGWDRDLPLNSPLRSNYATQDDFDKAYRFIVPGYNVRPLELCAAAGREQLKKLPAMTAQRRKNWVLFQELFGKNERFTIQKVSPLGETSAFAFTFVIRDGTIKRHKLWAALREANIEFRMVTGGCFLRHPAIEFFDYTTSGGIEIASHVHDYGFFVGNHPFDLTEQLHRLHSVLQKDFR